MIWLAYVGLFLGGLIVGLGIGLVLDSIKGSSENGRSRLDFAVLLSLLILVAAFVAWEMLGLLPQFPAIHTVSYLASHNRGLAILIGLLFVGGGFGGLLWWRHHLKTSIPK